MFCFSVCNVTPVYSFFKQIIVIVLLCSVVWACVTYECQEFWFCIFCYFFFILRLGIIRLKYQGVGWESIVDTVTHCGLGEHSRYSDLLWAGRA